MTLRTFWWCVFLINITTSYLLTSAASQEDEFTFDLPDDAGSDLYHPGDENDDYVAPVGKVFYLAIPKEESGPKGFSIKDLNRSHLPHWLVFNKKTGVFWGVPLDGDQGFIRFSVSPIGTDRRSSNITIHITDSPTSFDSCKPGEDETTLAVLLDRNLRAIKPKQRVVAVNNLAKFFRLPYSAFTYRPLLEKDDDITDSSVVLAGPGNVQVKTSKVVSVLQVPVGCDGRMWDFSLSLVHGLKLQARDGTIAEVLRIPVLGWRVKTEPKAVLRKKREIVEDYGSGDYDGDYYDENEDYDDEDDLGDLETDPPLTKTPITSPAKPSTPLTTSTTTSTSSTTTTTPSTPSSSSAHPHRHHHGEKPIIPVQVFTQNGRNQSGTDTISSTTADSKSGTRGKNKPTLEDEYDYGSYDDDEYDLAGPDDIESETVVPDLASRITVPLVTEPETVTTEVVPVKTTKEAFEFVTEPETEVTTTTSTTTPRTTTTTSTTTTTTEVPTTREIAEDTETPEYVTDVTLPPSTSQETSTVVSTTISTSSTTSSTIPSTLSTSTIAATETTPIQTVTPAVTAQETTDSDTTTKSTTLRQAPSTTTESYFTEQVVPVGRNLPEPRNFKPYIDNRLQPISVTAGKVFRFVIPRDTFKDTEDGHNLTLLVLDSEQRSLTVNSWLQYNPTRRELFGLPLLNDIHTWVYTIRATDKDGDFEEDQLTIQVQQHPLEKVFNHEFSLSLRIEKPLEYPHYIDWSLKVLRALGKIYGTNMSEITVWNVVTGDLAGFSWFNDSLSYNFCDRNEINRLYKLLTANDHGDPSKELSDMLKSDLRVKTVSYKNLTTCIEQPPPPPVTPINNFSPFLRNPVDIVNATLGEFLIVKVKEDTFYDPEDVDPARLNITLQTGDFQPIPPNNWLQFDTKNREFFGMPRKTGKAQYWLVCVDSGGKSAKDSLDVNVVPNTITNYNVEFSITLEVPFNTFSNNVVMQKKFVEKLMELFDEPTPKNLHFLPFKAKRERDSFDSTGVYWFNKSLPVDRCDMDEINRLEQLLHNNETKSISRRVHRIMAPDFTVSTIKVHLVGNCKIKPTTTTPEPSVQGEETTPPAASNEYLVTYILPAVIVAIMLFATAVTACILYRRKRMGKMNVEEDGRHSYGNKGIPVIFQEELEEKPEPGTKAPVILKDERPPLAPPEYSKSGSVKLEDSEPYQPPPPFTRTQESSRQPRPKPTPTYRKPPPYVPP